MAKFSLGRLPYYVYASVVCAIATITLWIEATLVKGFLSDVLMLLMAGTAILTAWSIYYMISVKRNVDDDVGVEIAGLPAGKEYYYIGVAIVALMFFIFGYQTNHNSDGFWESSFGILCFFLGLGLLGLTYMNYKSFDTKRKADTVTRGPTDRYTRG